MWGHSYNCIAKCCTNTLNNTVTFLFSDFTCHRVEMAFAAKCGQINVSLPLSHFLFHQGILRRNNLTHRNLTYTKANPVYCSADRIDCAGWSRTTVRQARTTSVAHSVLCDTLWHATQIMVCRRTCRHAPEFLHYTQYSLIRFYTCERRL
jgi:hypothetical protein